MKKTSRIRVIFVIISAILLYGIIAGIRANSSILITEISDSTGLAYGEVSTAFAVLNLVFAVSIILVGFLTLRIPKAYLMIAGTILCAVGFLGASFSSTLPLIILFLGVLFGIGGSLLSFTIVFSAAKIFVEDKIASILSGILMASQGALGMLLSHFIDGFSENLGITAFLLSIALSCVCLIPFTFIFLQRKKKENHPEEKQQTPDDTNSAPLSVRYIVRKIVTNPFFLLIALGTFVYGMGDGGLMNHSSQYLEDLFHTDEYTAPLVSVYSISIMAGALTGGFIAAKVKSKSLALGIVLLLWVAINPIISLVSNFGFFGVDSSILAVCLTFLTGFMINASMPLLIMFAIERISTAATAIVLAIIDCLTFLSYSADSFLGGLVHDLFGSFISLDSIVTIIAAITGVVFIIVSVIYRKKKPGIIF